ncbi:hypothetical protein TSAR_015210 [Trichomalopsis sarcophagae]|uniref:SGF29 C-terminal domain-containing protein n=1 Tax=Trichomalopsis sarcophagae TaxID=543379 RepID=A0A232FFC4_9HYME|nr:hypothetical protein TSAR_015210 [Trichomalopsis sarcophagae]
MAYTADLVAQQIQERLKQIHGLVFLIEESRGHSEYNIGQIEKVQDEVTCEEKLNSIEQRKLKLVYGRAVDDAKEQEKLLRTTLDKIHEIRLIRNKRRVQARKAGNKEAIRRGTLMKMLLVTAQTLPLYVGKTPGAKPPSLCGCIPAENSYVAKMGDMVAAFVKNLEGEENWILAEVMSFNHSNNKYEVDDVDEEEQVRHIVSRRRVVPLPLMRVNPETDAHVLFPKGAIVMALYPQTTCFYKAIVNSLPTNAQEEYEVLFEDESYADGYSAPLNVPQRYVISIKEGRKRIKVSRG